MIYYMQVNEDYARVINEITDIENKLKEVFHLPFMYCNHAGCNETVQLPNHYCYKHTPKKASDLTLNVDTSKVVREVLEDKGLLDIVEPKAKTKKTTK